MAAALDGTASGDAGVAGMLEERRQFVQRNCYSLMHGKMQHLPAQQNQVGVGQAGAAPWQRAGGAPQPLPLPGTALPTWGTPVRALSPAPLPRFRT